MRASRVWWELAGVLRWKIPPKLRTEQQSRLRRDLSRDREDGIGLESCSD